MLGTDLPKEHIANKLRDYAHKSVREHVASGGVVTIGKETFESVAMEAAYMIGILWGFAEEVEAESCCMHCHASAVLERFR